MQIANSSDKVDEEKKWYVLTLKVSSRDPHKRKPTN